MSRSASTGRSGAARGSWWPEKDPSRELGRLCGELRQPADRVERGGEPAARQWMPTVEETDGGDAYLVRVELPGIPRECVRVEMDMLTEACGIDPPREHGLDTRGTIAAMHEGKVKVFVGMGGNFVMAAPDTPYTSEGMRTCELTVQVSTKLNRSHVVHGKKALILPCLGRTEKDHQRRGLQSTSVEDSMSMVHLSVGMKRPASPYLLSEPAIIAGMARATLPDSATPWE